ncbi:hypothetical protein IC229_25105 [Spirosoma sp. BT702]|uniref:Transporter n=1 Tax=Spirosoma profusum TaxID=2771354 RepID=A0A927ASJ3_9BACT|nr:DUF6588 family protein [Spirosoma profusum]MBD2703948.1 hypothetical protein [Spirosoma profusum]
MKKLPIIVAVFIATTGPVSAQKVSSYLNAYLGENKNGYLQPLADLVISGMNTGLQPSVRIDNRFYVRFNLTAIGAMPMSSQKTFTATSDGNFTPQQTATVPTIVGANQSVSVRGDNGLKYVFPGGYGLKQMLWAIPQLSIGGIKGTELSLRLVPYDFGGDFGKLQIINVGVRHDVGQYFLTNSPLVLNVGYAYNKSDIGRYVALQSHFGYVQAGVSSKQLGAFLWAGYQMGTFDMHYDYVENARTQSVVANLKTKQPFLGGIGLHAQLGFFSLGAGVGGPVPLTGYTSIGFRFGSQANTVNP